MLFIFKADEKLFQTGWMLESVISAMVVMLIVRTARPVIKSKASKNLLISIVLVSLILISIIYIPINSYLGLVALPFKAFISMICISIVYAFVTEILKKKFYKHNWFSRLKF